MHEITAFEHKIHQNVENIRKGLIRTPILILLIVAGVIFLYFAGVIKMR